MSLQDIIDAADKAITPEDIIELADKNIDALAKMIEENPNNASMYEYKLAVMQWYKQEATRMLAKKREQET